MFKARQAGTTALRLKFSTSALAWALAMAVWLSGCGPGVGGTGTGETNSPADFGAVAASVCTAAVGGVLGCVAGADAAAPGATPVFLADAAQGPRVQARVQDNTIDLAAPCTGLQFSGQWGEAAGQAPRFFGSTGSGGAQMPATLQMDLGAAGTATVVVTLRSAAGKVLLGPTQLLVVPATTAPQACP